MVTIEWKSPTELPVQAGETHGVVAAPIQHQGVREALVNAFASPSELPRDLAKLLAKLS
jgi:hypothetical protein